jgi:hypothetical protein
VMEEETSKEKENSDNRLSLNHFDFNFSFDDDADYRFLCYICIAMYSFCRATGSLTCK